MKRIWMACLALGLLACSMSAQDTSVLKTQKDKLSYAIGMEMGQGVKAQDLDIDLNIMVMGLKDALSGGKGLMSQDDLRAIISGLSPEKKSTKANASDGSRGAKQEAGREAF